ncbi:MAG: hypothetical protein ACR2HR_11065 [Euzebya sp.]
MGAPSSALIILRRCAPDPGKKVCTWKLRRRDAWPLTTFVGEAEERLGAPLLVCEGGWTPSSRGMRGRFWRTREPPAMGLPSSWSGVRVNSSSFEAEG